MAEGNPELYDPTNTCRPTSQPTVGRLTANSWVTNGRQSADSFTSCVGRQSPDCWGSVGLVSTKCRLLVMLVRVRRYTVHLHRCLRMRWLEWENNKLQAPFWIKVWRSFSKDFSYRAQILIKELSFALPWSRVVTKCRLGYASLCA